MSDEAEPLYSDEGEHVGWAVEAEDGAIIALDLDATGIVGAMDPGTGELIDASAYELDNGADPYADLQAGYDELEQRIAAQEQQEPAFSYIPPPDPDGEEEVASWRRDLVDIERAFDRSLTDREKREIATWAHESGQGLIQAAEDLASRSRSPIVDIDEGSEHQRRAARAQLMAEQLGDINDPADVQGVRAATRASYDLDVPEQRRQWAADRLEGRDLADAAVYNGTDSYATPEEETWTYGDLD